MQIFNIHFGLKTLSSCAWQKTKNMLETTIAKIQDFAGKEVQLKGWVYNKRESGKIIFLQLRDGSGFIQGVVVKSEVSEKTFENAVKATMESSVVMTGTAREDKRAPSGFEILVFNLELIQVAEDYPITKKEHGPDFLLDHRHLWLRSKRQWAIQRVRNDLILGIYDFLHREGFIKIDAPIFTPNACEGTTTLFEVDYFGNKAYLSQSGQLYLEAAIFAHGKVFDFGPTFRAEKSKTRRHLTEFWMMDAEMAFYDWKDNIDFQEKLIVQLVQRVLRNCQQEMKILERDTKSLEKIKAPFMRLTYVEALEMLRKLGSDIKEGEDFGNDDETMLTQAHEKPIFVSHFPHRIKAFYMSVDETGKYVLCNDLLAPEGYGEIIGGGQRETDFKKLLAMVKKHNLPQKAFEWYLDLRRYGSVTHSGFGLGLERLVAWVCGLPHVRETIPFPRMLERMTP